MNVNVNSIRNPLHFLQRFSQEMLTVACEIWGGHVLDGDLLQEGWFLAARVSTDHPGLLQPLTKPGQMTITHIRVGQEVSVQIKRDRNRRTERNDLNTVSAE